MSKERELTPIEAVGLIPEAAELAANIVAITKGDEKPVIKAAKIISGAAEFARIVAEKCDLNGATKLIVMGAVAAINGIAEGIIATVMTIEEEEED